MNANAQPGGRVGWPNLKRKKFMHTNSQTGGWVTLASSAASHLSLLTHSYFRRGRMVTEKKKGGNKELLHRPL